MMALNATIQDPTEIHPNPIGLDRVVAEHGVRDLNDHLASMVVLFHQYHKHHWLVQGPQFRDLHLYLQEAYTQVHQHFDQVAERITVLGGVPTASPQAQAEAAYIRHEEEGVFPIRLSLQNNLKAEQAIAGRLRLSIVESTSHGDFGTEILLKQILAAAGDRAHHLDHYLAGDSLEDGSTDDAL